MTDLDTPTGGSDHSTMGDTQPNTDGRPGGLWHVSCTCGWEKTGRYARTNEIAEAVALRLANAFGEQHERNPLAEESAVE